MRQSSNPAEKLYWLLAQRYTPGQMIGHAAGSIYVLLSGSVRCRLDPRSQNQRDNIIINASPDPGRMITVFETDPSCDYIAVDEVYVASTNGRVEDIQGMTQERLERYRKERALVVTDERITVPPPGLKEPITRPEPRLKVVTPGRAFSPTSHTTAAAMPAAKVAQRQSPSPVQMPPAHDEPPVTQPSGANYPGSADPVSAAAKEQHADSRRATLSFGAPSEADTAANTAASTASVPPAITDSAIPRSPIMSGSKPPHKSGYRNGAFEAPSDVPPAPTGNGAE